MTKGEPVGLADSQKWGESERGMIPGKNGINQKGGGEKIGPIVKGKTPWGSSMKRGTANRRGKKRACIQKGEKKVSLHHPEWREGRKRVQ